MREMVRLMGPWELGDKSETNKKLLIRVYEHRDRTLLGGRES